MRSRLIFCLLLLLTLLPVYASANITRNLSPQEAYEMVGQRSDLFLLDVRTFGEYRQARLDGARLIPIDQFVKRLAEVPRNRPVLVYCAVGSRR